MHSAGNGNIGHQVVDGCDLLGRRVDRGRCESDLPVTLHHRIEHRGQGYARRGFGQPLHVGAEVFPANELDDAAGPGDEDHRGDGHAAPAHLVARATAARHADASASFSTMMTMRRGKVERCTCRAITFAITSALSSISRLPAPIPNGATASSPI